MSNVISVDENNFETEVLQSKLPVLVDFGAPWCGPCQRQIPIMEKFAAENVARVKVCQIDVDDSPAIAFKFGIKSVPSILLFHKGVRVDAKVGLTTLAVLDAMVTSKITV